jgi:RNA polymerase sigma-70 factor (ECF subfamily)
MQASLEQIEIHRPAIIGHCYRMLGSAADAEDATQEAILRAWRGIDRFDGRASLRTWLYRIATNVCLDELQDKGRRARPMEEGERISGAPSVEKLVQRPAGNWLEPIADAAVIASDANPAEQAILRQTIRLAFVAALQHLAPRQRAALILVEVLGWSAAEVAESLDTTVAAVNSALQRARATLAERDPAESREPADLTEAQRRMVDRYAAAFERYDVDAMVSLLREDATFSMPPYECWLRGPADVRTWLLGLGSGCRGSRLIPTAACGLPAWGQYRPDPAGGHKPWALIVLELTGDQISGWNTFLDTASIFPRFGLPLALPA